MDVRYPPDAHSFKTMTTPDLRKTFLIENLFKKDKIQLTYSHIDRAIVGSAVPGKKPLALKASKKELAADYFAQRREIGVINIGKKGTVEVDKQKFSLGNLDCLYIGRGSKSVQFSSTEAGKPALFYLVSYPAHADYPTTMTKKEDATPVNLGSEGHSNKRTIYKYIYPDGIKSAQLVLGFTVLETGSVWNTMPIHTHERRSEIYMYFNLKKDEIVCHLMGQPQETRHLIVRNDQAVLSPSWSFHSGAGTSNYSFVWSMGGENQEFDDMDWVAMQDLY
jgi:4-deoxy-L-threo-5-hexosulose-uronate ketol-isomerase